MKLPSSKEEWQLKDYISVINKIAETATGVLNTITGRRASGEKKEKALMVEKIPEEPQQVQEQSVSKLHPQTAKHPAQTPNEEKKLDPELEEYINNMKVTDSGFIDQYGNLYKVQEGKPDINAFKKWAYENPEEVRKHMERSKELYEKFLTEKKKAEETTGTANTSNNNSKLP